MTPTSLRDLAAELGGSVVSTNAITLVRHGVTVEYELADRGAGSNREAWTEVSARFPAHYPLRMTIERGRVKLGEPRIDIELGTPLFDEFFIVEAAPSDVVRHLVDDPARQFLLAQPGLIELRAFGDTIRYATIGWVQSAAKATELADYVAGLASRVRDAYAAANVDPVVEAGDPYRPQAIAVGRVQQVRREQELDQLRAIEQVRYDRFTQQGNRTMMLIIVGVVAAILLGLVLVRGS